MSNEGANYVIITFFTTKREYTFQSKFEFYHIQNMLHSTFFSQNLNYITFKTCSTPLMLPMLVNGWL